MAAIFHLIQNLNLTPSPPASPPPTQLTPPDFGYDISSYVDVDPIFGTMEDFDALSSAAKVREASGLRTGTEIRTKTMKRIGQRSEARPRPMIAFPRSEA